MLPLVGDSLTVQSGAHKLSRLTAPHVVERRIFTNDALSDKVIQLYSSTQLPRVPQVCRMALTASRYLLSPRRSR
jgi:hypothetical protein